MSSWSSTTRMLGMALRVSGRATLLLVRSVGAACGAQGRAVRRRAGADEPPQRALPVFLEIDEPYSNPRDQILIVAVETDPPDDLAGRGDRSGSDSGPAGRARRGGARQVEPYLYSLSERQVALGLQEHARWADVLRAHREGETAAVASHRNADGDAIDPPVHGRKVLPDRAVEPAIEVVVVDVAGALLLHAQPLHLAGRGGLRLSNREVERDDRRLRQRLRSAELLELTPLDVVLDRHDDQMRPLARRRFAEPRRIRLDQPADVATKARAFNRLEHPLVVGQQDGLHRHGSFVSPHNARSGARIPQRMGVGNEGKAGRGFRKR